MREPDEVGVLAEELWDRLLAIDPLLASSLADHRYDDRLPDLSAEAAADHGAALGALADRATAVAPNDHHDEDRVTLAVVAHTARTEADQLDAAGVEFTVSPALVGPHVRLLELCPRQTLPEPQYAEALLTRYSAAGVYLDTAAQRLRDGVARQRTPPRRALTATVRQLDAYLAAPVELDPLLNPAPPPAFDAAAAHAWRERLTAVVADVVRPGLARYRECLADEIAPHARSDERCGVAWLPDGDALYERAIEHGTSLPLTADELHQAGLDAVAALADEYRALGGRVLGTTDVTTIFTRLRDDPALRLGSAEDVLRVAETAVHRAEAAMGGCFGRLPRTPCEVRPMLDHETAAGTIAYYFPPAPDGTRPGAYYVNTAAPTTRTRYEAEALAFHEAVPGHHTQIAIAQELDGLPALRRNAEVNAYVEGWALYSERLADEMGLYSGDLERLGMLSFDSWRACRLVVDTGLHHLGWDRDKAVAYLRHNSPQALNNIANEIDRYIAWPGQALGYKVGQQELFRLRDDARRALGGRFDIAAFHDTVLGHGALPLTVLRDVVTRWADRAARA